MRNTILIILLSLLSFSAFGQGRNDIYLANRDTTSSVDIVYKKILENTYTLDAIEGRLIELMKETAPAHKLYPTQNTWTFLELDTVFGSVYHVQWSTSDNAGKWLIGNANSFDEPISNFFRGRYELYATSNIYTFILLDTKTGDTYQVQWSTDMKNEGIWPIKKL